MHQLGKLPANSELFPQLFWLRNENIVSGSERYIRGEFAAAAGSPLLDRSFCGFKSQTSAFSAKSLPPRAKLVIIQFAGDPSKLKEEAEKDFSECLNEVIVKDSLVQGRNMSGNYFLFEQKGDKAFFVL